MTHVTDDQLQELYRRQTRGGNRKDCLTADQIASMAKGGLAVEERRRVALHLADCSDCSLELRMAKSLEPWTSQLAEKLELGSDLSPGATAGLGDLEVARRDRELARRERRRWMPAALAASLALVAVSAYLLVSPASPPRSNITRGSVSEALQPADDAVVGQAPQRFSWPAQLGAESYRLQLFDARAELLWESASVQQSAVDLPPPVRQRLEAPGSYVWTVAVEGAVQRSRLGPFSFRIEPR